MGLLSVFSKRKSKPEDISSGNVFRFPFSKGTYVSENDSMKIAAFYRGVVYISSQIAKLPWEVKNIKREDQRGRIWNLLNGNPNPEMTAFHFRLFMLQWALIRGNAYAEIERDALGRAKNLWPLNPGYVTPKRMPDGELVYEVSGQASGNVYLKSRDVFHLKNLHTFDGMMGLGLAEYAQEILGISRGADIYANATYSNGGMPSGIISYDGKLSPEAAKRVKEDWQAAHGGRKTGGTAVLEQGAKYTAISHDQKSLQFIESRQFGVVEIARFLGLPPSKLFDTESQKFKNIEHANLEVVTDTLDAWARNCESEADSKLIADYNMFTEMDLRAVFRGDMKTRAEYFNLQMQNGAITPNEIRKAEGRPDYEDGDKFYIATNNLTPASMVDEVILKQSGGSSNNDEVANTIIDRIESSEFKEALKGSRGQKGKRGESVFDIWKKFHNGNEEDFLKWIKETGSCS